MFRHMQRRHCGWWAAAILSAALSACGGGSEGKAGVPLPPQAPSVGFPPAAPPASPQPPPSAPVVPEPSTPPSATAKPRVVVSMRATNGMNPFHEYFRASGPLYQGREPDSVTPEVLAEFDIGPAQIIDLAITGTPEGNYAANRHIIEGIEYGRNYWFRGTNIIATIRGATGHPNGMFANVTPNDDDDFIARDMAAILGQNPDAILYLVFGCCREAAEPNLAWATPAVDIFTRGFGITGALPVPLTPETGVFEAVINLGKLVVMPPDRIERGYGQSTTNDFNGPWWIVSVGTLRDSHRPASDFDGVSRDVFGIDTEDIRTPHNDFVADHSPIGPSCGYCDSGRLIRYGDKKADTLIASALVGAGAASRVLLEARRVVGHLGGIRLQEGEPPTVVEGQGKRWTVWDLRRALEEAAWVPDMQLDANDPLNSRLTVIDAAPWLTVGWGQLTSERPETSIVPRALAVLGLTESVPVKPVAFCDFQTLHIRARKAFWNYVPPFSPSIGMDHDPFVYCDTRLPF